jgi:hypothetical protein
MLLGCGANLPLKRGSPPGLREEDKPFIMHSLLLKCSEAWRGRGIALVRLIEFLECEHLRHGGLENGHLIAPYSQLRKIISRNKDIAAAIEDGIKRGLIRRTSGAKFEISTGKHSIATYRLTYRR